MEVTVIFHVGYRLSPNASYTSDSGLGCVHQSDCAIEACAWSIDGSLLAACITEKAKHREGKTEVRVVTADESHEVKCSLDYDEIINTMAWDSDGKFLAIGTLLRLTSHFA
jgi:hypothetical protein